MINIIHLVRAIN